MKVAVCAGGTAGHVNPALSLCQELKSRDESNEILFIGTKDKMESKLVPKAGFAYKGIDMTGFQRSMAPDDILYNIKTVGKLLRAGSECKKILEEFSPDAVVGFGGYVSGPVVRTAHKMGIKTAIHEQNAFPGKTNIELAKYVDAVMLTSPDAEKHMKCKASPVTTGLPVRSEILSADSKIARKKLGIPENKKVILSTGGSLGAQALNNVMCEILAKYQNDEELYFIHGYGSVGKDEVPEKLAALGVDTENNPSVRVSEYIYDMADCMAAADLMICRAGASTIAEIQALGKAAMFIPYPYAAENHQYYNALALTDRGAGIMTEQRDFSAEKAAEVISLLKTNPEKIKEMGRLAGEMAVSDASAKICDIVCSL